MEALLLLMLLAQTPAPKPSWPDYPPPDPPLPLPLYSTRPEDDEQNLIRCTFKPDLVVFFGEDLRSYLLLGQDEHWRVSAGLSRDGIGFLHELYLGHGFEAFYEIRSFLFWSTARVGIVWFPVEDGRLSLTLDLARLRIIPPTREELLQTAATWGALYLAFGPWYKP